MIRVAVASLSLAFGSITGCPPSSPPVDPPCEFTGCPPEPMTCDLTGGCPEPVEPPAPPVCEFTGCVDP